MVGHYLSSIDGSGNSSRRVLSGWLQREVRGSHEPCPSPAAGDAIPEPLPAISLVAVPGRRRQTLEIAREIEKRGFSGIYMPSRYGNMAQCTGLALATERITFGTAIAPIYAQTAEEFAASAAYIHEVSGGRFRFGIGVAHGPTHQRLGISPGKPLADTRVFVEKLETYDGIGALPPVVLAALRQRMVALAAEIAEVV